MILFGALPRGAYPNGAFPLRAFPGAAIVADGAIVDHQIEMVASIPKIFGLGGLLHGSVDGINNGGIAYQSIMASTRNVSASIGVNIAKSAFVGIGGIQCEIQPHENIVARSSDHFAFRCIPFRVFSLELVAERTSFSAVSNGTTVLAGVVQ